MSACTSAFPPFTACSPTLSCGCRRDRPSGDLMPPDQRGHGSGSGVAVSERVFQLFELRRGLVVRQEDFLERSKALEAAGLRE
jgi:hypothetical protein